MDWNPKNFHKKLGKLLLVVFMMLSLLGFASQNAPAIELFSSGMATPETISPAPSSAYGGQYSNYYFIPDPGRTSGAPSDLTNVWKVNKTTGAASIFSHPTNTTTVGGLFLPSGWGDYSNKFMTVGSKYFGTPIFTAAAFLTSTTRTAVALLRLPFKEYLV